MMIKVRRVYEGARSREGKRFLVDGLWPRGVRKEELEVEAWVKEVAPSGSLRKWFSHREDRWEGFLDRYFRELDEKPDSWRPLLEAARRGNVTLLFGAKDEEHNNAVALKRYLDRKLSRRREKK